jgi:hypothetical protein
VLGGSVAVAQNRSINTLPSTTSPTNTTKQTKSMLPSKATRRRPLPSEPRATPSRRRVRKFHTRSLCSSIGTVVSIRNVACPKLDSTPCSASPARIVPRTVDRKFEQMRATTLATAGHLARSKASHSGISGRRPLRSSACTASRVGHGRCGARGARVGRRCRSCPLRPRESTMSERARQVLSRGRRYLTVMAPGPARAIRPHGQRALVTDGGIVRPRAMAVLRLITSSNRMFVSSSRRPSRSAYLTSANTLKGAGFRVCARPAATTWPRRCATWRDQPRN